MTPSARNIKKLPKSVTSNQELIEDAMVCGCLRAQVIMTKTISLARWVKIQCQYGCPHYANRYTCPPSAPTLDEMSDLLMDYERALVIQADQAQRVREIVVALEGKFRTKGYHKAFGLCALPCDLCEVCTVETQCKYPELARPTLQACGIDVPKTIGNTGWEFGTFSQPCSESQPFGLVLLQ